MGDVGAADGGAVTRTDDKVARTGAQFLPTAMVTAVFDGMDAPRPSLAPAATVTMMNPAVNGGSGLVRALGHAAWNGTHLGKDALTCLPGAGT
ncbi:MULTISPECIES: hypothetical protein [unclassified Pseudofrankia]|uniref:hypothetical protein n=1 Tax=unclassified Pseudofrankia TaxID=2994372 RepID=UPI00104261FF|nr:MULTISPECIES: hypothetical protein [unclassified Pseudofrankia]MDT3446917.1 hypothetical protein [Pseudofrankia sp. BMG5.37]